VKDNSPIYISRTRTGQVPAAAGYMHRSSVYALDMSSRQMQEPSFLILTALAAGPQHGYGIMTDVAQISDGRVKLRAGTLYAALDRLSLDRLLEVDREEIVDTRLRRYYRLTPAGRSRLTAETARLRANAAAAAKRLGLAGS
jgi:DNA-binding PadR family transcriptional regulator